MTTYITGESIVFTNNKPGSDITLRASNGKKLIIENVETTTTNTSVVNILQANNFIGQVGSFAIQETEGGFIPCQGQTCSKADFPELYAKLGDTFGSTTETFTLPDYTAQTPFYYSVFAGLPKSGFMPLTDVNYSFVNGGSTNARRFFGESRTYVSGNADLCTFLSIDSFKLPTTTVGRTFILDIDYTGSAEGVPTRKPVPKTGLGIDLISSSGTPDETVSDTFVTNYKFVQTAENAVFEFITGAPTYPSVPYSSVGNIILKIE